MSGLSFVAALVLCAADPASETINPVPLPARQMLVEWGFDQDAEAGPPRTTACRLSGGGGSLKVDVTGEDPTFTVRSDCPGNLLLEIRAGSNSGSGSIFWTATRQSPRRGPDKEKGFAAQATASGTNTRSSSPRLNTITDIRLDPGFTPGEFEIDYVRLVGLEYSSRSHAGQSADGQVQFRLVNRSAKVVAFSAVGREQNLEPAAEAVLDHPATTAAPG